MKGLTIIHILLFLLLMLVYQCAGAQDYVLTTRGDSLTGEVKPLVYGPEKKVQITEADKNKITLSLFEVRAYSQGGEIFHPVKGDNGYVFMKLIKPGYLSLYAFQQDNQMRYDGLFLKKVDGDQIVVPNLGFKKYISKFLEDCPKVSDRIKEGELGKKNLAAVVDDYNACIQNRTINHKEVIVQNQEQTAKINAWDSLEESIKTKDFKEKTDALEMISEIKKKIQREEKIPNFLVEGLKNSLQETGLSKELDHALDETGSNR
jgi:hypothetical protein